MGTTIQLTAADGHTLDAYKAEPDGTPRGGIVVVQEIFGVNIHIREVCDGFAADGYTALAPAMFDRVERGVETLYDADSIARGRGLKDACGWDDAVLDMNAASAALAPLKTGLVGYCWGGSLAWLAATRGTGIACSVAYYGGQVAMFKDETPKVPVLLHFGDQDASIPMDAVAEIRAAHPDLPLHVYEGAGHGFNCDHRGSYDEGAARLARERTMAFFAEHLG
jgi:carboxymethylenebutenolidase